MSSSSDLLCPYAMEENCGCTDRLRQKYRVDHMDDTVIGGNVCDDDLGRNVTVVD